MYEAQLVGISSRLITLAVVAILASTTQSTAFAAEGARVLEEVIVTARRQRNRQMRLRLPKTRWAMQNYRYLPTYNRSYTPHTD